MVVLKRLCWCLLLPLPVFAAWYQGQGIAPVLNGDEEQALEQATRAALRDAILNAGGSVTLMQEVKDESVSSRIFQVRSSGHINQIQKLQEYSQDNRVSVTLKADIWSDGAICENQHLTSKSLVMVPFILADKAHARYGGLDEFADELTHRLFSEFDKAKADFLAKTLLDAPIGIDPDRMSDEDKRQLQYLSEQSKTQYIVMGKINDLSIGKLEGGLLSSDQLVREFGIALYLIDGVSGLPIIKKDYHSRTVWPFAFNETLSSRSDQLWLSDYGLEIKRVMREAVDDLSALLVCARPKSRIIRVGANTVEVAIGARQGIKTGDIFKLQYQFNYFDEQGVKYANYSDEAVEFEVVKVYPDHSQLLPVNSEMPLGIQIRDIVQLDSFWE
ncbi:hypothetical protein HR45_00095 [Shewanella mangrovi]|uniref:Lipoprotein n=1 Tax=Shewanella mangrovi TaxID=1515746 RepID=A0A094JI63_9GAMM|nr:flagellar assembly protein T N-terminal domain-containing protein [Shewanella mangrovi]KFZ38847.1 hypothetical protein HR45_00095 [Shewanella mangrovi]